MSRMGGGAGDHERQGISKQLQRQEEGNHTKGLDKHRAKGRRCRESELRTQDTASAGEDVETREPQARSLGTQTDADTVENRTEGP